MTGKHTRQVTYFRELAAAINEAMTGVPSGWQGIDTPKRTLYQHRVDEWHRLMAELYDGLYVDLAEARLRDSAAIERLITFLEADVVCHRSGYFKVDAIKELLRVNLSQSNRRRLEHVVLDAVDGQDRREFRAYTRLARKLDNQRLRSELQRRLTSDEFRTRRHAGWALAALADNGRAGCAATLTPLAGS